jgi:hypothetical protein
MKKRMITQMFPLFLLILGYPDKEGLCQCTSVQFEQLNYCLNFAESENRHFEKLKNSPAQSLSHFFYSYFSAPDLNTYRNCFVAADWYGLSSQEFANWKKFLAQIKIEYQGQFIFTTAQMEIGIIKYSYVLEEQRIYETFMAKRIGGQWKSTSRKEEELFMPLTQLVHRTQAAYLKELYDQAREGRNETVMPSAQNTIFANQLEKEQSELKMESIERYRQKFNDASESVSDRRNKEDRTHDADFMAYLTSMHLTPDQQDTVMHLIVAENYLQAAVLADKYSPESYTYAPFVYKIREVYGKDRIHQWDPLHHKWD